MIKVGLTGNIASGKTEVEKIISKKGYLVFDLDKIVHNFFEENEEIKNSILKEFNTLNRKTIGNIVFKDKKRKKTLENIIHPKLKEFILNTFKENKNEKIIVISGALLFEANFDNLFDKIIFIDSPIDIRLERLMKRNSLTKEEAFLRINSQNQNNKLKANCIIENNSTIEELETKVNSILHELICNK